MFSAREPDPATIDRFLKLKEGARLTYSPPGLSALSPPGFAVDVDRFTVGHGHGAFLAAADALRSWKHFPAGWVELHPPAAPVREGSTVAVLARHLGFWSLNPCRVVHVFEAQGKTSRFGFSYGTLEGHAECGEERFVVEMDATDEAVTYEVRAVSRPRALLAWLGYPFSRRLQSRFRRESGLALKAVVAGAPHRVA